MIEERGSVGPGDRSEGFGGLSWHPEQGRIQSSRFPGGSQPWPAKNQHPFTGLTERAPSRGLASDGLGVIKELTDAAELRKRAVEQPRCGASGR